MKIVLATAAMVMVVSVPAQAQSLSPSLARMDTNKDGKLNLAEWVANSATSFARMDADKDGSVTRDEVAVRYQKAGAPVDPTAEGKIARIMAADANGDGKILAAEAKEFDASEFKRRDKNADGVIGGDDSGG